MQKFALKQSSNWRRNTHEFMLIKVWKLVWEYT